MTPLEWSPWVGCSPISTGCQNCYAMKPEFGSDLTRSTKRGPIWTGALRFDEASFDRVKRSEPATFLVCPHGDLFHERASDEWINRVLDTIAENRQHRFQVLTKRTRRMREIINGKYAGYAPRNLSVGVSAERQAEANDRIPDLFGARIFPGRSYITLFPLLGPIDFAAIPGAENGLRKISEIQADEDPARPAEAVWFSQIAAQCHALGLRYRRANLAAEVATRGF